MDCSLDRGCADASSPPYPPNNTPTTSSTRFPSTDSRNHFRISRRAIVTVNLEYRCRKFPNSR